MSRLIGLKSISSCKRLRVMKRDLSELWIVLSVGLGGTASRARWWRSAGTDTVFCFSANEGGKDEEDDDDGDRSGSSSVVGLSAQESRSSLAMVGGGLLLLLLI